MKKNETLIRKNRNEILNQFILNGKDIIIDDNNYNLKENLLGIVRFRGTNIGCAPLLKDQDYYNFMELYYNNQDENIHLFTKQINGPIVRTGNDIDSIINDCLNYNEEHSKYLENTKIFAVYLKDCFITIGDDIDNCFINKYSLQSCN